MSGLIPIARRIARTLAVLALLGALSPAAASAGTFKEYTCKLPDGSVADTDGWAPDASAAGFSIANDCAQGGALRIQMQSIGLPQGFSRAWHWSAPNAVSVEAAQLSRAFSLTPGDSTATPLIRFDGATLIEKHGATAPNGDGIASRGSLADWAASANLLAADASSVGGNHVDAFLECYGSAGASCPNTGATNSELRIHAATFTLAESIAPVVSNVRGALTDAGPKQGVQRLTFSATDSESGVYRALVDVDGSPVSSVVVDGNAGRCADAVADNGDPYEFQYRTPCRPQVDNVEVPLDTRLLTDGTHTLRVRVEDAAGNRTPVYGPATVTVANTPPATQTPTATATAAAADTASAPAPNGVGGGTGARMSTSRHGSLRVRYGRAARLTGRLVGPSGVPIPGALIEVYTQTRVRGAQLVHAGTVTSDAGGSFSYTAAVGASRLVRFAYRAHVQDTDFAQTSDVDLQVIPRVTLRLSARSLRNGQTVRYRGMIAGPNTKGGLAEIRARTRGRWVTVCVVRIQRGGRFGCPYRFRHTTRPTTYFFRAVVRRQSGLPYEGGTSSSRSVRVRP